MQRVIQSFMNKIIAIFITSLILSSIVFGQHRGDNLSFQGLSTPNDVGVNAIAMGGAYLAQSGNISSIFWNPAGLSDITKIQISISGNSSSKMWRENQEYRPNRYFVTLPYYLEGLYIPDPKNSGQWDYQLAQDSSYYVNPPVMGQDPFSKAAADWQVNKNNTGLNNVVIAVPFDINKNKLVVSVAYDQQYDIQNFDRNDTYLNPHIGYTYYGGNISRASGNDTITFAWSRFLRQRTGSVHNITGGVGYRLNKYFALGIKANIMWGKTEDLQTLKRVGSFDLADENRFRFNFQNVNSEVVGTSKFNATSFSIGGILNLNHFSFGAKVALPYTVKRNWNYNYSYSDSISSSSRTGTGVDKFNVPLIYSVGVSFKPVEKFNIEFDFERAPYSQGSFNLASNDTTHRNWVDQNTIRLGAKYDLFDFLSILAGYSIIPQTFVPDGSAIKDKGPVANNYSCGVSIKSFLGEFNFAYEFKRLKYYDSYFSNTNYNMIDYSNFLFGYTYKL